MDKEFHLREDISIEKETDKQKIFNRKMAELGEIFRSELKNTVQVFDITLSIVTSN